MSAQNIKSYNIYEGSSWCSRCIKSKTNAEFTRLYKDKLQKCALYNLCAEQDRKNKKEKCHREISPDDENIISLSLNNKVLENVNNDKENEDKFIYDVCDLEEIIACKFRDNEEKEDPVKFSAIVEIEKELINDEILSLKFKNKKQNLHNIINALLIPLQEGSGYYWKLRNLYINKKNNQYTAQPAIEHFSCNGAIVIKIDLCDQHATIFMKHEIFHERPTYRDAILSVNAMTWIKQHINQSSQKIEFTNNFNVSEVIINLIFKTNQECFELFAVNANYGGYSIPLAYLYVSTHSVSEEQLSNSNNEVVLPAFMVLDKDSEEVIAVQEAWSQAIVQLCLWHVKHAIEFKEELLKIITRHVLLHLLIPMDINTFLTAEEIQHQSVFENWCLFARAAYSKAMPIARTTIIAESIKACSDIKNAWRRFHYNHDFLLWWDVFKHNWKFATKKEISTENSYHTDIDNWICSCSAFLNNSYLIYNYPLVAFEKSLSRINLNNNPWNNSLKNVEKFQSKLEEMSSTHITNTSIHKCHNVIKNRKIDLKHDMITFEKLVKIINDNIENDRLYKEYRVLVHLLIAEVNSCQEVLNAKTQQTL
ncbi:13436_t:CDS:2 [Cetraspora pellucida]|uniref:13436_t:CDS:1 n=1 Tax=Cetraspora pellucida TaxID=1433469 RepID=A0ACA9MRE3_9GLOM|nr:13436_t:CDS:2 [Cetraspora pellucida]